MTGVPLCALHDEDYEDHEDILYCGILCSEDEQCGSEAKCIDVFFAGGLCLYMDE